MDRIVNFLFGNGSGQVTRLREPQVVTNPSGQGVVRLADGREIPLHASGTQRDARGRLTTLFTGPRGAINVRVEERDDPNDHFRRISVDDDGSRYRSVREERKGDNTYAYAHSSSYNSGPIQQSTREGRSRDQQREDQQREDRSRDQQREDRSRDRSRDQQREDRSRDRSRDQQREDRSRDQQREDRTPLDRIFDKYYSTQIECASEKDQLCECPICAKTRPRLYGHKDGEAHPMCEDCARKWFERSNRTCPFCRKEFQGGSRPAYR